MSSWWGKSSSKEAKRKVKRESIIDTMQQKFKKASEEQFNDKSKRSRRHHVDIVLEKGSRTAVPSRSPSPHVSRCQSCEKPLSQPLPLPGQHLPTVSDANSGVSLTTTPERVRCSKPSQFPLPKPGDVEGEIAAASVSSDSSIDGGDSPDSHGVSPLATDCENRNRSSTINSFFRLLHKDQSPITVQKNSRAPSTKWGRFHLLHNLRIPSSCGCCSAPPSSMSTPSTSPTRAHGPEQVLNSASGKPRPNIASGQCSCPGSGSGHNSGGDLPRQVCLPQNRSSLECSPIPSPRMTSPGPSSRIQSGAITPLHPRTGATASEMPIRCPEDVKQQSHPLPLPPITATNSRPFSPNYSTPTTPPSAPRSPVRAENPTSQGSRWKKGKLLGRGTFGQVYLGFDRESGEMCAMKEVTLFEDDPKSKECAQQLGQEIALLSRLRHPNIVRYYGSETVDDKLYIYLEYVSGGSIHKLLQEYGQLGEIAIRSYTRQILSGLAYLHAKNTVHRDIKGANILVDPNGCIKLADFGMAKYVTGSSPFSFKGSPHWMAPEVIKNSNGCNIAVDIWSLGCTVLEMATSKPPWGQYEGVAAMFKVIQARDIPEIPDHLSEDGKNFVRLCLQRNPENRPSAAQLLEHPFVKKVTPERSIMAAYPPETPSAVVDALRSMAIGPAKPKSCLELELADIHPPRSLRTGSGSSDTLTPRNISCPLTPRNVSCPVSPVRDLLLPSRTPDATGRVPPSPIASPSFVTSSGGAISSFNKRKQPIIFSHEAVSVNQKPQGGFYHQEPKHDLLWGPAHASRVLISPDYDALANHNHHRRVVLGGPTEFHNVPQQLLRDYVRPNNPLDRKASTSVLGKINGL